MTQEMKKEIYEMYINPENRVSAIAEKYNTNTSIVTKVAMELGATPRRPHTIGKRGGGRSTRYARSATGRSQ